MSRSLLSLLLEDYGRSPRGTDSKHSNLFYRQNQKKMDSKQNNLFTDRNQHNFFTNKNQQKDKSKVNNYMLNKRNTNNILNLDDRKDQTDKENTTNEPEQTTNEPEQTTNEPKQSTNEPEQSTTNFFGRKNEVEELIKQIKETVEKIDKEYERKTEQMKKVFPKPPRSVIALFSFFATILDFTTKNLLNYKVSSVDELEKKVEDAAKDAAKHYGDELSSIIQYNEKFLNLSGKGDKSFFEYVLKNFDIMFDPEHDWKACYDVTLYIHKYFKKDARFETKEGPDYTPLIHELITYLSKDEKFIKKITTNYLKVVVQKSAPGILGSMGSGIKEFFKSPLSAMKKLKDAVKNIYDKIGTKYGRAGQFIAVIVIVVLIWIAVKKIPILGRFFGNLEKWLLMPINKIKSFFSKAPGLLEAYLSDPVARRLIETNVRRMDIYAALYLSV